jgi:transposase
LEKNCLVLFSVTLSPLEITIPPTIITPALSLNIKQRIVQLRQEHLTLREIADRLKVSVGVVHKTLTIHEEDGEYTDPSKQQTGRPQILDDDDEWYLRSLLESNPSMYLGEIKQKLEAVRKVSVSIAAVRVRALSRLSLWLFVLFPDLLSSPTFIVHARTRTHDLGFHGLLGLLGPRPSTYWFSG